MTDPDINAVYAEIEQSFFPVLDFLEKNTNVKSIANNYKGFITLQSPLVYNPDILFIGINPGHGAFKEYRKHNFEGFPLRIFNPENPTPLDWYKDGNARGESIRDDWHAYKWFDRDKRINNSFVANMIDLFYQIAAKRYPEYTEKQEQGQEPYWYKTLGQNVMFTNLYPIATSNAADLNPIFSLLVRDPKIKSVFGGQGRLKKWDAQRFFVHRTEKLVSLVKPKVIVCLGTQAFNDFTYTSAKKTDKLFKAQKGDIPVIGIDRSGNWSGLIPALAEEIVAEMK